MKFPTNLEEKINSRIANSALRILKLPENLIDFSSNDYLGFSKSKIIFDKTHHYLQQKNHCHNGATGSRLLTGNHELYAETEKLIADFHETEAALIFNSGYDANIGFFQSVPQRNDLVLFDNLCHASIRDGILSGISKSFKFNHNDFEHLEKLIKKYQSNFENIYIITESVFSMDGDSPNLEELVQLSEKHQCLLIVDEAHSVGVFGENGCGLVQELDLQTKIFARIVTFGKGLGCHGAAIVGGQNLCDYLINFARSFIYTTGLSPHSVATILMAYQQLPKSPNTIVALQENIKFFNRQKSLLGLKPLFIRSKSAIQSAVLPGNLIVKKAAQMMAECGFDVKPILSPTVPEGQERLRFCLHSYNTETEIKTILNKLMDVL